VTFLDSRLFYIWISFVCNTNTGDVSNWRTYNITITKRV